MWKVIKMHEIIQAAIAVGHAEANRDMATKFDSQNGFRLLSQTIDDLQMANDKLIKEIEKYKAEGTSREQ